MAARDKVNIVRHIPLTLRLSCGGDGEEGIGIIEPEVHVGLGKWMGLPVNSHQISQVDRLRTVSP